MSDSIILPLEERFSKAARGRRVEVRYEEKDFLLAYDYHVKLEKSRSVFEVTLRRGGLFEGAYRCLERAIEAMAERLDGISSAPTGYCDCREEMMYWGLELAFEQFLDDLKDAVGRKILELETYRHDEAVPGGVGIESRRRNLEGMLKHLEPPRIEVRKGILSPGTISFLRDLGICDPGEPQAKNEPDPLGR